MWLILVTVASSNSPVLPAPTLSPPPLPPCLRPPPPLLSPLYPPPTHQAVSACSPMAFQGPLIILGLLAVFLTSFIIPFPSPLHSAQPSPSSVPLGAAPTPTDSVYPLPPPLAFRSRTR